MAQTLTGRPSETSLLSSVSASIRGIDSPHQLSMGIVLGAMLGIVPKDNLVALCLFVSVILAGNLLTAAVAIVATSLLSPLIASIAQTVGEFLLGFSGLQSLLALLFQQPLGAWTRLDNTLVVGTLAVGLVAAGPLYLAGLYFFHRYRAFLYHVWNRARIVNWVIGYSPQEK